MNEPNTTVWEKQFQFILAHVTRLELKDIFVKLRNETKEFILSVRTGTENWVRYCDQNTLYDTQCELLMMIVIHYSGVTREKFE